MERATIFVRGYVQGVGFRWWVRARALELGLVGYASNLDDGRVEICAQGDLDAINRLASMVSEFPSTTRRPGRVESSVIQWGPPRTDLTGFRER
jgi:acylphosphatase